MPPGKFDALANLTYLPSAKALILCNIRHWEVTDGIYGGVSYTDQGIQQCWYPSDNAGPASLNDRVGRSLPLLPDVAGYDERDVGRYVESTSATAPEVWIAQNEDKSHSPGVFLAAYMYGPTAQHFSSLSDSERYRFVLDNAGRLHHWLNDGVVRDFKSWSWDDSSSPGGGAYAFFSPGEHGRYQPHLTTPLPEDEPRIFFAGEHVAVLHAWMQGAMQSGMAAAKRVAAAP